MAFYQQGGCYPYRQEQVIIIKKGMKRSSIMLSISGIKPFLETGLAEKPIEKEQHNKTYRTTISFKNREEEHVGDLDIYFVVKGFGFDGENEEIDVHFNVPFFTVYDPEGDRFMEEAEAMQFVFINFATEVQDVVDQVLDQLYDHYENGTPLNTK